MSEISGVWGSSNFEGNTILVGSVHFGYNKYVFFSVFQINKLSTVDKIIDFITLMGNNMNPCATAVGEKYTYFLSDHYNIIQNIRIDEGTQLNSTKDSLNPFDYHLAKCS